MWMIVGEHRFRVALSDTPAAQALAQRLPLALEMADLNRNEKHVDLPESLPTNASRAGTIQNGDVMLYGDRTIVVFYKTFPSAYSYTRLGRVENAAGLSAALGSGSVRVELTAQAP